MSVLKKRLISEKSSKIWNLKSKNVWRNCSLRGLKSNDLTCKTSTRKNESSLKANYKRLSLNSLLK